MTRLVALSALLICGCAESHGLTMCTPGEACVVAGTGERGDRGDEGAASNAQLDLPIDVSVAPDGSLVVVDWNNNRIRAIDARGTIRALIGDGTLGEVREGDALDTPMNHPTHVAFDAEGRMLVSTWLGGVIARVEDGQLAIVAGTGERSYAGDGGRAIEAAFDRPVAGVVAGDAMRIADQSNQVIREVGADGAIERFAGACVSGGCAAGESPARCPESDRYACASGDPELRCHTACEPAFAGDGGLAIDARFAFPTGAATPPGGRIARGLEGELYVADTGNHRVRRIDADGTITTVAGSGARGTGGDGGPATAAALDSPGDVDVGPDGTIYVADTGSACIRAIDASGVIRTIAGACGMAGTSPASGPAEAMRFDRPSGIAVDAEGRVFVADTANNRVVVVVPR